MLGVIAADGSLRTTDVFVAINEVVDP